MVVWTSPLSAVNPRVWQDKEVLCARTSLLLQVLCLFFWCKTVRVNPRSRTVSVQWRYLWFLRHQRAIHFKHISHLDYRYSSLATEINWLGDTTDAVESYAVALVLEDRSEVTLMKFRGEGARTTGLAGVLLGDSLIDVQGDQGDKSLRYIDALQEITGKGLSKPLNYFKKPTRPEDL
jgi:hypothetical protein